MQQSPPCTAIATIGEALLRDQRVANAIRLRRIAIRAEMERCVRQWEDAYGLADVLLEKFDELDEINNALRAALEDMELRLLRSWAYFLSEAQPNVILDRIAEVGADTRRFCAQLGAEALARIAAHEFHCAPAALEAKRRTVS
jgi:ERCC4-related helicase